ncbi:hypothetical protein GF376_01620 [Candidatus Peregrinibacteria bacterium]|nr:hypothetical protein [Candidatus Peregrinibacteria bacterium]
MKKTKNLQEKVEQLTLDISELKSEIKFLQKTLIEIESNKTKQTEDNQLNKLEDVLSDTLR